MAINSGELNDFFEQILHTERSLSSRNTKLRQLKGEIQSCVQAVEEVCQEVKTQQGELAVCNMKMVDEEVEARLLALREAILEQQNSQLLAANQALTSKLEAAKSKLDSERDQFLEELREFEKSYDLVGAGYKHREQLTQKRVATLQDEVLLLETELAEFECEREEVRKLEQKLAEAEKSLVLKQEQKRLLGEEVVEGEAEIVQLKEECESFGSRLPADPEILRLQKELDECKDCPEERRHHSLQQELEELQRLCYQRQMRQHMSQRKPPRPPAQGKSSYDPCTHQYDGGYGRAKGGSNSRVGEMGSVRECDEALDEGEEGEGEEGWDDELEAAELASLQECLGDSDMNWTEEEENGDRDDAEVMGVTGVKSRAANTTSQRKLAPPLTQPTHQRPTPPTGVRTVVKRPARETIGVSAHLAQVTDSPATLPARKSSGQSIYKAPCHQEEPQPQNNGVPRTAKRVRFRY